MKDGRWRAWAAAAASGILLSLSFPSWLSPSLAVWPGWLAFVALAPLLAAIVGAPPGRAAALAWAAGTAFHASALTWIAGVEQLGPFATPAWAALSAALGTYWGAWGWLVARGGVAAAVWTIPAGWAVAELARGAVFTGFPWLPLGASQWANPVLFPSIRWTGVAGLSMTVASVNAFVVLRTPRAGRHAAAWVLGAAAMALAARWSVGEEIRGARPVTAAALQGGFTEDEKWSLPLDVMIRRYERLAGRAAEGGAALLVWPETATASVLGSVPGLEARLRDLAAGTGAPHLVGALAADRRGRVYNGAFVFTARGIEDRYFKSHLVPFGEYMPRWVRIVAPFTRKLAAGFTDLAAGDGPEPVEVPLVGRVGVAICYEAVFSRHARDLVTRGAELFVNMTNDSWYGRSAATAQHALGPICRSVECGRFTIRCANTGLTLFCDPVGRVETRLALFEPGVHAAEVRRLTSRSPHVRAGEAPALAAFLAMLAVVLRSRRGGRR